MYKRSPIERDRKRFTASNKLFPSPKREREREREKREFVDALKLWPSEAENTLHIISCGAKGAADAAKNRLNPLLAYNLQLYQTPLKVCLTFCHRYKMQTAKERG